MPRIGPYKLGRVLGTGGMGQVFEATNTKTGLVVALKVIKAPLAENEASRLRFVQEATAVLRLRHPNIVAIHDFGQSKGALYIAMECLPGRPLTNFIPGPPILTLRRKLLVMAQCAEALEYAHSRGVIHRDVKPANMIILPDRSLKLVDFGLAELIQLQHPKTLSGTPPYMSPEQLAPLDVDGRTDIWSAGVTLFELLTGQLPFRNLHRIIHGPPPVLPPGFPFAQDLNRVLAHALARDRENRYATAQKFADELRSISSKCELAVGEMRSNATGDPIPKAETPSSVETLVLPAFTLAASLTVPIEPSQTAPPRPSSTPSSSGNYVLLDLGFKRPAAGNVESQAGTFQWGDRAKTLRTSRDNLFVVEQFPKLFVAWAVLSGSWWGVLKLLPRLSPDYREEFTGIGLWVIAVALMLLLLFLWLLLSWAMKVCPAFGTQEHRALCKSCGQRMARTGTWTRVCSSREEVFFGYRDCMAALKHRLWQEAAKLLSIYGEEDPSNYRAQVISASVRYHISFFECEACAHHAARLTSDEMTELHWEEKTRFEEAYWGASGSAGSSHIGLRSQARIAGEVLKNLFQVRINQQVLAIVALIAAISGLWVLLGASAPAAVSRRISAVAWSSNGRWLAAGTAQGRISVWDMTSGTSRQVAVPGPLRDFRFSPAGNVLAIASSVLSLYSPTLSSDPQLLRPDHKNYQSVEFSPDGQKLLIVTAFGMIEILDARTGAIRLSLCCSSGEARFTPDGEVIANAGRSPALWNSQSGQYLGRLPTDRSPRNFFTVGFDPTRNNVLMGSDTAAVWVWNWRTGKFANGITADPWWIPVDELTVSQTGLVVFSGSSVEIWDRASRGRLHFPDARPSSNLLLIQNDGLLIFGTAAGEIEFWDMAEQRRIRTLKIP